MPAVILLDQRRSRHSADRVGDLVEQLNTDSTLQFLVPVERTVGDELEALTADPDTLASVALVGVRSAGWWIGIGIGVAAWPLPPPSAKPRRKHFGVTLMYP